MQRVRFLRWCETLGLAELRQVQPFHVAAYVEQLQMEHAAPTVKQHLAGIRMLFDWSFKMLRRFVTAIGPHLARQRIEESGIRATDAEFTPQTPPCALAVVSGLRRGLQAITASMKAITVRRLSYRIPVYTS